MKTMFLIIFFSSLPIANAEVMSFEGVWSKVKQNSPTLSREEHSLKAAEIAVSRKGMHWLPSLTLGASAFLTNDPASNFFSNLSQRQITSLDFSPGSLNQPGSHSFETGTLGLDFPLYEGGRKSSELQAMSKFRDAQKFNQNSVFLNEYVDTAVQYAKMISYSMARERLAHLSSQVGELISRYSIGSQSNPVGYSGLLGLRSLKNRVAGELLVVQSKALSSQTLLSEKIQMKEENWSIQAEESSKFLDRTLSLSEVDGPSFQELSLQSRSEALDAIKGAESARFLPKLGLFANEGLTHGDRASATSFTGGVYLQWSLFNPENVNQISEKEEQHQSALAEVEVTKQSSTIARKTLTENEKTLKQNLALLLDSENLLAEQVKVASRLFQSGSISALQLSEVLNRRADLILSLMAAEQGLIEVRGKLVMLSRKEGAS